MSQCRTLEASEYSRRGTPSAMLRPTTSATCPQANPARSGPYPGTGPNRPGDQVTDSPSALAIWVLVADRTPCTPHQLLTVQTRVSSAGELSPASSPGRELTDRSHKTCSI